MATLGEYLQNSNTKLLLHLNGNSTDSSGNGNNGTDTNITYSQANGKFGQGAGFTRASGSKIVVGTSATLQPTTALTFSLWLNVTNNPVYYCAIAGNSLSGTQRGYQFDMDTTRVVFQIGDGSSWGAVFSPGTDVGVWVNYIGTWDGATVRLYKNGNLVGTPVSKASINYTSTGLSFGHYYTNTNSSNMYDGKLDEVIIENRAWTASEVKKYYTYSRGFYSTI